MPEQRTDGIGSNDVRYARRYSDSNSFSGAYEEKETQAEIVYKTKTGRKYHKAGCSYLKSKIETTLNEAIVEGLTACSRCFRKTMFIFRFG